jgi:hypothetical protein
MDWYGWALVAFIVAEKIVKESDAEWDDILVDGLKYIFNKFTGK